MFLFFNFHIFVLHREETSKLKEGEQEKTKDYTALVWVAKEVTPEMLETFDKIEVRISVTIASSLIYSCILRRAAT